PDVKNRWVLSQTSTKAKDRKQWRETVVTKIIDKNSSHTARVVRHEKTQTRRSWSKTAPADIFGTSSMVSSRYATGLAPVALTKSSMTFRACSCRFLRMRNMGDSGIHSRTKISRIAGNTMANNGGRQSAHIVINHAETKPARAEPIGHHASMAVSTRPRCLRG